MTELIGRIPLVRKRRRKRRPPSPMEVFFFVAMCWAALLIFLDALDIFRGAEISSRMLAIAIDGSLFVFYRWLWRNERNRNNRDGDADG